MLPQPRRLLPRLMPLMRGGGCRLLPSISAAAPTNSSTGLMSPRRGLLALASPSSSSAPSFPPAGLPAAAPFSSSSSSHSTKAVRAQDGEHHSTHAPLFRVSTSTSPTTPNHTLPHRQPPTPTTTIINRGQDRAAFERLLGEKLDEALPFLDEGTLQMWRSQDPKVRCLYYAAFGRETEGEGELLGFATTYEVGEDKKACGMVGWLVVCHFILIFFNCVSVVCFCFWSFPLGDY